MKTIQEIVKNLVKGDKVEFTYDDKPRSVIVERTGADFFCGNCQLSGGFRNFRHEKIQASPRFAFSPAYPVPFGWDKV